MIGDVFQDFGDTILGTKLGVEPHVTWIYQFLEWHLNNRRGCNLFWKTLPLFLFEVDYALMRAICWENSQNCWACQSTERNISQTVSLLHLMTLDQYFPFIKIEIYPSFGVGLTMLKKYRSLCLPVGCCHHYH